MSLQGPDSQALGGEETRERQAPPFKYSGKGGVLRVMTGYIVGGHRMTLLSPDRPPYFLLSTHIWGGYYIQHSCTPKNIFLISCPLFLHGAVYEIMYLGASGHPRITQALQESPNPKMGSLFGLPLHCCSCSYRRRN